MAQENQDVGVPTRTGAGGTLVPNTQPVPPARTRRPATHITSLALVGEDRRRLIAEAAYFRAEQRGFAPGSELEDWLAAEIEIDTLFGDDERG